MVSMRSPHAVAALTLLYTRTMALAAVSQVSALCTRPASHGGSVDDLNVRDEVGGNAKVVKLRSEGLLCRKLRFPFLPFPE